MSREAGFLKDEDGQGMVEYALIIALIAIACLVVMVALGRALLGSYSDSSNKILDALSGKVS